MGNPPNLFTTEATHRAVSRMTGIGFQRYFLFFSFSSLGSVGKKNDVVNHMQIMSYP